ncbi:DUF5668 domain-containing protein [Bacillus sp. 03113]|uniref:DUF5668 domain-containing protein n=1 Tax=Bacillus sp. 03113 TaxID=2578211 RepID=UPI00215D05A1|nr:DUF5668 domain-containing protein [Bacillus sp. 03113]
MRTWRVGTFSMGTSLLILGVFLLLTQLFKLDVSNVMLSWWPIILVVLGAEILVFLFQSKQEKPFIKYDFLSIFFIGILGTAGIGFSILSSIGIMDKIDQQLTREERTMDLPAFNQPVDENIKRVVLQTKRDSITVEGTGSNDVSIFGTYRMLANKNDKNMTKAEDYVSTFIKGDTLYVSVKELPEDTGPFERYASLSATILIPNDVKMEIEGNGNDITLKPRTLLSNWRIDNSSTVSLDLYESENIQVAALGVQGFNGQEEKWSIQEEKNEGDDEQMKDPSLIRRNGTLQKGDGSNRIDITNSAYINLKQ